MKITEDEPSTMLFGDEPPADADVRAAYDATKDHIATVPLPERPATRGELSPARARDLYLEHVEHGKTILAIAREQGIDEQTVRLAIRTASDAQPFDSISTIRKLMLARMDQMESVFFQKGLLGDRHAANVTMNLWKLRGDFVPFLKVTPGTGDKEELFASIMGVSPEEARQLLSDISGAGEFVSIHTDDDK